MFYMPINSIETYSSNGFFSQGKVQVTQTNLPSHMPHKKPLRDLLHLNIAKALPTLK